MIDLYDIDDWFEESKDRYLVLPRSVMQSMPKKWQAKMVALLQDLDKSGVKLPEYSVSAKINGRYIKDKYK